MSKYKTIDDMSDDEVREKYLLWYCLMVQSFGGTLSEKQIRFLREVRSVENGYKLGGFYNFEKDVIERLGELPEL